MKKASSVRMGLLVLVSVLLVSSPVLAAWGSKEMDTEKIAVNFAKEMARGGYKIVTTEELKGWFDQKKDIIIVDTMPFEDSYKKQHISGAVQIEFPIPEMTAPGRARKRRTLKKSSVRTRTS